LRRVLIIVALLLALQPALVLAAPTNPATGTDAVKSFVIVVGRNGFNGTSSLVVEVNQGDTVSLTFVYGDTDLARNNPHAIAIVGYGLSTPKLGRTSPNATIQFVAGQAGDFVIHCTLPCLGMDNLQNGILRVDAIKGKSVATSTFITHLEVHNANILHIVAGVQDQGGLPLAGVTVSFDVNTTFGMMEAGTNVTSVNGLAEFEWSLPSTLLPGVEALFKGSGQYAPSNATEEFLPSVPFTSLVAATPFVSGQNAMIDTRLVGVVPWQSAVMVSVVLLTVGSVWIVYAYAVRQIISIRSDHSRIGKEVEGKE
jgi:hypothetical protein